MLRPDLSQHLWSCTFLVALTCLGGPAETVRAQTAAVVGCVTDEAGRTVPGATVVISGTLHGSASDAGGCFHFIRVAPGSYRLRVTHAGHFSVELPFVARRDAEQRVDVVLRRRVSDSVRPDERSDTALAEAPLEWLRIERDREALAQPIRIPVQSYDLGTTLHGRAFGPDVSLAGGTAFNDVSHDALRVDHAEDGQAYLGAGFSTNTGWSYVSAGAHAAAGRSSYRFDVLSAGAGRYEDGNGATVGSRFRGAGVSARARRLGAQTAVDLEFDAKLLEAYRDPGSRLRYEGGTTGRLELIVRHARERSSVSVTAQAGQREQRLSASSFPDDAPFTWEGSRDAAVGRIAIDARRRVTQAVTIGALASAGSLHSAGRPTRVGSAGAYPFPGVRDRSAGFAAHVEFDSGRFDATARAGLRYANSALRAPVEERRAETTTFPVLEFESRYVGPASRVRLSVTHDEAPGPQEARWGVGSLLRAGQVEVSAIGSFSGARRRTTTGRIELSLDRGMWTGHASVRVDRYHRLAAMMPATDTLSPWQVTSHRGWAAAVDGGVIYEPAAMVRSGARFTLLRGVDETVDGPIAGLPSSTVAAFARLQFPDGHPFLQWTTLWRPERQRVAAIVGEVASPSSVVTDVEAGMRYVKIYFSIGVFNIGNRAVRDHSDPVLPSGRVIYAPGRSFFLSARYVIE